METTHASGFASSFPVGTKVHSSDAMEQLKVTLIRVSLERTGSPYDRVLLINSIGYALKPTDPILVDLATLANIVPEEDKPCMSSFHQVLQVALPVASVHVLNRAKDPVTKRHKYPQVINDFSEALAHGGGPCGVSGANYDAIVDWGGGSYKIYAGGQRIGTAVMDANHLLCKGNVLQHDRLRIAVIDIKSHVLALLPVARKIFIAQTGKARELALKN
mmetsp:Transcript_7518/g.10570  ORF Transcript_7518/g.10570 Transcript_7518/m.10570 type:complete len:218 (+) Transcript_7518:2-655(+)